MVVALVIKMTFRFISGCRAAADNESVKRSWISNSSQCSRHLKNIVNNQTMYGNADRQETDITPSHLS